MKTSISTPKSFNWHWTLSYLAGRAIPGVERVDSETYERVVGMQDWVGTVRIEPGGDDGLCIDCELAGRQRRDLDDRIREMFDMDSDVDAIDRHLKRDKSLVPIVTAQSGLRLIRAWDPFELAVRAILGQQVTVAAASTLAGRLVRLYGSDAFPESEKETPWRRFPSPSTLAEADLFDLGMPRRRATTVSNFASAVVDDSALLRCENLDDFVARMVELPGIGPWTAHYVALRGCGKADAFPDSDLGLIKAASGSGPRLTPTQLRKRAEAWQPYRGYAAMHLWRSLG